MMPYDDHCSDVVPRSLTASLIQCLGTDSVIVEEEVRALYSADLFSKGELCALVVQPRTTRKLAEALSIITSRGFAAVPRGAGLTYVQGYTPPTRHSVVVDTSLLNRIIEINEQDMYITVEAGVTWKQIHEALQPRMLRLPFFGTFSGARATVGGGLSNGALFFGTARYGSAAEIVLGMTIALADGSIIKTGQGAIEKSAKPFFRSYGPDLTGLFTHDGGAFGVKAEATLRLIRTPPHTDFISFEFPDGQNAVAALSEIGRSEISEEAYLMDPQKTSELIKGAGGLKQKATLLARTLQGRSVAQALQALTRLATSRGNVVSEGSYSLHAVCASRTNKSLEEDMRICRNICSSFAGVEIASVIPAASRAELFSPVNGVLGLGGERWIALNAKVPHSDAAKLLKSANEIYAHHADEMRQHGVTVSSLMTVMSNHSFSFEPVFTWKDSWLPLHRQIPEAAYLKELGEPPAANPAAWDLVNRLRAKSIDLFTSYGAASSQIGRTYPYFTSLNPRTRAAIQKIKAQFDPDGLMNPGVLGLH